MIADLIQNMADIRAGLTAKGAAFETREIPTPRGPVRAYNRAPVNLNAFFLQASRDHGDKVAAVSGDNALTYGQLYSAAQQLGDRLRAEYGVRPGDRVGIVMRNRPEWFQAYIAVVSIGGVATLLNSRGAGAEIASAADRVECSVVIADEARADRLKEAGYGGRVLILDDLADAAVIAAIDTGIEFSPDMTMGHDDPAMILFTSGTTGQAKGATLSHGNITNMLYNLDYVAALSIGMRAAQLGLPAERLASMAPVGIGLMIMPLFHISGIVNFFGAVATGGLMVMIERWHPETAATLIEKHKVNRLSGPSLVLADLVSLPNAAERLKTLGSVSVGGQATPTSLVERVRAVLPQTSQGGNWGMTEAAGSVTSGPASLLALAPTTVGMPSPVFDLKIVDDDGAELGPNERGEILLRGGIVMSGYWGDVAATEAAFADGWYRTGDIGYLDEHGLLFIADRSKDMIISAGENIYCAEVEAVLSHHQDYKEVALFGVPDDRLGERAVVAIVAAPGADVTTDSVQARVRAQLADYKVPSELFLCPDALPRNAVGKVDKARLKALFQQAKSG